MIPVSWDENRGWLNMRRNIYVLCKKYKMKMQGKKKEKRCGSQRGLVWREEWGKSRLRFRSPFSFKVLARKKKETRREIILWKKGGKKGRKDSGETHLSVSFAFSSCNTITGRKTAYSPRVLASLSKR